MPPPTWKLWELRPPPTLDCRCRSFIFVFVFACEVGSLPRNNGLNPVIFIFILVRGYLVPRETFALQIKSISRGPADIPFTQRASRLLAIYVLKAHNPVYSYSPQGHRHRTQGNPDTLPEHSSLAAIYLVLTGEKIGENVTKHIRT